MNKRLSQKEVERFIKRKIKGKLSFNKALFVVFLICGSFLYSNSKGISNIQVDTIDSNEEKIGPDVIYEGGNPTPYINRIGAKSILLAPGSKASTIKRYYSNGKVVDGAFNSGHTINNSDWIMFKANVIIGHRARTIGNEAVAIGAESFARGSAVAIGSKSIAYNKETVAIGEHSYAENTDDVSLGHAAFSKGSLSTALGSHSSVESQKSVAIGYKARVDSNYADAIALGSESEVDSSTGTITKDDKSNVSEKTWISETFAEKFKDKIGGVLSIGKSGTKYRQLINLAPATEDTHAVTLGQLREAMKNVGGGSYFSYSKITSNTNKANDGAKADHSLAIGVAETDENKGLNGIAIGTADEDDTNSNTFTRVSGKSAIAIGSVAIVESDYGIALGKGATVSVNAGDSVAIGKGSKAENKKTTSSSINAGTDNKGIKISWSGAGTAKSVFSVGASGAERIITNVADGSVEKNSKDAINGGQLSSVIDTFSNLGLNVLGAEKADSGSDGFKASTFDVVKYHTEAKQGQAKAPTTFRDAINQSITAINSGLSFSGDDNKVIKRELGQTLKIVGDMNLNTKVTNITVNKKDNEEDTLQIKLSENLSGIQSIANGNNKIELKNDNNSIEINFNTGNGLIYKFDQNGLNLGNKQITNLASGLDLSNSGNKFDELLKLKTTQTQPNTVQNNDKLKKAVNVQDLLDIAQALVDKGYKYSTDIPENDAKSIKLGSTISINRLSVGIGESGTTPQISDYVGKNLITRYMNNSENPKIEIGFKKNPSFEKVTLDENQKYAEKDKIDSKELITKGYLEEALNAFKIKVKANNGEEIELGRDSTINLKNGLNIEVKAEKKAQPTTQPEVNSAPTTTSVKASSPVNNAEVEINTTKDLKKIALLETEEEDGVKATLTPEGLNVTDDNENENMISLQGNVIRNGTSETTIEADKTVITDETDTITTDKKGISLEHEEKNVLEIKNNDGIGEIKFAKENEKSTGIIEGLADLDESSDGSRAVNKNYVDKINEKLAQVDANRPLVFMVGNEEVVKGIDGKLYKKNNTLLTDEENKNVYISTNNNSNPITIRNVASGLGEDGTIEKLVNGKLEANKNNIATVEDLKTLATAGITVQGNEGEAKTVKISDTLNIKGTGNISVASGSSGLTINMNRNLTDIDSITMDKVKIGKDGLDNGGNRITKLADGIKDDDAATVGQVKKANSKVSSQVASAIAIANIPQVADNKTFSIGAATGYSDKEYAIAVGISGTEKTNKFIYKLSAGIDSQKNVSVGAGFNYNFGKKAKSSDEVSKLKNEIAQLKQKSENELNEFKKQSQNELNDLKKQVEQLLKANNSQKAYKTLTGFKTDEYKLTDAQIKEVQEFLKDVDVNRTLEIIGYTDIVGNDKYNLDLGYKRAIEVANIATKLGYKNISIKSSGFNTIADNKTNFGNRRVEINVK